MTYIIESDLVATCCRIVGQVCLVVEHD